MEQKTIWMPYLQIGAIFSILLLFNACKKGKTEYERSPVFHIINATSHQINFDAYPNTYNIKANSSITIEENQVVEGKENNSFNYSSPYKKYDNSPTTIRFDQIKCLVMQTESSEHSITNINSFIAENIDRYNYKFTYTFTEADYNRAVTCP
ncbi:hypothetical protein [Pedobacter insulae]|uniref:Uncharacterized protein n=1 Tax=Pedobacter insulae TaxID=414048 RepID=A0A1I2ZA53_9SPHI|nr:hypothetical protein [Pedobacter insulae]SFH34752.1 hypothetical protein SAMN04489864_109103 [Pedobacter insulae]